LDDIEIRPTVKFVCAGAIAVGVIVLATWTAFVFEQLPGDIRLPAAVTLLLLWPFWHWARTRTNLTVLTADRLRSETGLLAKSTRNLMLSRIQDVGVEQSLSQRIFNTGSIWIETAGASSRVLLHDIDNPKYVADQILERSRGAF
jgi:uncharacterized membrane protein YdbT with pleckstrin-like domain